jgi:hypothetical protein
MMTDQNEEAPAATEIVRRAPRLSKVVPQEPEPLFFEERSPPQGFKKPQTISKQIPLLVHEHTALMRAAKRAGKDGTRMLKDTMMLGLRLTEEMEKGNDVAVMKNGRVLYKILL